MKTLGAQNYCTFNNFLFFDLTGQIQYQLFEDCEHKWVATPGPQTDRAVEMVKAFIAAQLQRAT